MEGIQKMKCSSCGTMFMSETEQTKCPTCVEQQQQQQQQGGNSAGGHSGCGCGHSH
jgi:Zn finger protein HypA/HybF involved in hydrogenase expression